LSSVPESEDRCCRASWAVNRSFGRRLRIGAMLAGVLSSGSDLATEEVNKGTWVSVCWLAAASCINRIYLMYSAWWNSAARMESSNVNAAAIVAEVEVWSLDAGVENGSKE
jgi:hypothetical protein